MVKNSMPDRWDSFSSFNKVVRGTCIMPHKTPLKTSFNRDLTPTELVQSAKEQGIDIKHVVDLTSTAATDTFYCPKEFNHLGVCHTKIQCPHDKLPSPQQVQKFKNIISTFVSQNQSEEVITVHCTYGVNCTGYMIARYLVDCQGWSADDAINEIELARGHIMERMSFIEDLLNRSKNMTRKRKKLYTSTLGTVTNVCNCYPGQQSHTSHLEEVMFSS